MSDHTQKLLAQLDSQLANRSFEEAGSTLSELQDAYQSRDQEEQRQVSRAMAVSTGETTTASEAATLTGLATTDGSTKFGRVAVVTMTRAVVETNEELSSRNELDQKIEKIRSALEDLQVAETALSDQSDETDAVVESKTVPPYVSITRTSLDVETLSPGETATLTVDIENIGEQAATNVEVNNSAPDSPIPLEGESVTNVDPGSTATVKMDVSASQAGSYSIGIQAIPENGDGDFATVSIRVTDSSNDDQDADVADGDSTDTTTETTNREGTGSGDSDGDDTSLLLIGGGVAAGGASVAVLMKWLSGDD